MRDLVNESPEKYDLNNKGGHNKNDIGRPEKLFKKQITVVCPYHINGQ